MKKILVTGGAGFIGTHLCRRLHGEGNDVISVDDLSTGTVADETEWEFVLWDVREPFRRDLGWMPIEDIDEIYHLACPASPRAYQADPIGTMMTNVVGTYNVLQLAEEAGARVLFASTSEVYGDPEVHPQPEDYCGNVSPTGPRACYDEGKRAAESLCFDFWIKRVLDVRVARIFNTYGPGMQPEDGRVISTFIRQALDDEPLSVYGDGTQTRAFCYIDDMVEGLVRLMATDVFGPVNLGNPVETTINAICAKLENAMGTQIDRLNYALPVDDPRRRLPDITLARELLKWQPQVPLDDGIRRTIEWFRTLERPL